jgi:hypothetical protein
MIGRVRGRSWGVCLFSRVCDLRNRDQFVVVE